MQTTEELKKQNEENKKREIEENTKKLQEILPKVEEELKLIREKYQINIEPFLVINDTGIFSQIRIRPMKILPNGNPQNPYDKP